MKSVTDRFKAQAQRDALRFAEADENGDNALSWSEFLLMQPPPVRDKHGDEEIRSWFEEIDADGDGSVSINEYFTWTLSKALHNGDSGLRAVFMEYDKDGTGCLDAREFQRIADDIGFGAAAHVPPAPVAVRLSRRCMPMRHGCIHSNHDSSGEIIPSSSTRFHIATARYSCTRLYYGCIRQEPHMFYKKCAAVQRCCCKSWGCRWCVKHGRQPPRSRERLLWRWRLLLRSIWWRTHWR